MAEQDMLEALRSVLTKAAESVGPAVETWDDRVNSKSPDDWNDEEWNFANSRGLIPADFQVVYETKLADERHAAELARIRGEFVDAPNFGGNLPGAGTATVSPPLPSTQVSPAERLRQIEEMKAQLEVEEAAALDLLKADEEAAKSEEAPPYEEWSYNDLKAEAQARGLDTSGKKEELTARLYAHDESSPS
jgi:hypothetical protein